MEAEMVLDRMDAEIESEASAEILMLEIGESYSDDEAERVLSGYEKTHGRAYKRPNESFDAFARRAEKFKVQRSTTDLDMDTTSATQLLRQLREVELPADAKAAKVHTDRVHGLEDKLGVARTDFAKPRPSSDVAQIEVKKKFNAIEFEKIDPSAEKNHVRRHPDDRIALINIESDSEVLQMIIAQDDDATVRAAAEVRLGMVELDTEVRNAQMIRGRLAKG